VPVPAFEGSIGLGTHTPLQPTEVLRATGAAAAAADNTPNTTVPRSTGGGDGAMGGEWQICVTCV
jgi:hypothetical protein